MIGHFVIACVVICTVITLGGLLYVLGLIPLGILSMIF